jgi:hypothetical protein
VILALTDSFITLSTLVLICFLKITGMVRRRIRIRMISPAAVFKKMVAILFISSLFMIDIQILTKIIK